MYFRLLCIGATVASIASLSVDTVLSPLDKERLKSLFESAKPYDDDLQGIHYSLQGLAILDVKMDKAEGQRFCNALKSNIKDSTVDSLFYASGVMKTLKEKYQTDCQPKFENAEDVLAQAISNDASSQLLYYALTAQANLNMKMNAQKAKEALQASLKRDDSPMNNGYVFMAASLLSGDLKEFHDLIEDVVPQADEIEGTLLQYEGGLFTTAVIVDGIYRLATTAKKAPTMTDIQIVKFTKYLLNRKFSNSLRNTAAMLSALHVLTNNPFKVPVAIFRTSPVMISRDQPSLQLSVSDVFGNSLSQIKVNAESVKSLKGNALTVANKQFKALAGGNQFEYDIMSLKPSSGPYTIAVTVVPDAKEKRLVGATDVPVSVNVAKEVAIAEAEIAVLDREQNTQEKSFIANYPNAVASVITADTHQKITVKFGITDTSTEEQVKAHQVFVKLANEKRQQEIIFVAESDKTKAYMFDLDVGAKQKEFGRMSGKYSMEIMVGDEFIKNSIQWKVADVKLEFREDEIHREDIMAQYEPQEEIEHMFRPPEPRPPSVVSNLYTLLALAPLGLLVVLWYRIGFSIDFPFSIRAIGFHSGLGLIFIIYAAYWWSLDMFVTLKYLSLIGIPTSFCGNKLLATLASKKRR